MLLIRYKEQRMEGKKGKGKWKWKGGWKEEMREKTEKSSKIDTRCQNNIRTSFVVKIVHEKYKQWTINFKEYLAHFKDT